MQCNCASAVPREEVCSIWGLLPCDEEQGQAPEEVLRSQSYGKRHPREH
jgi:hypothetical protein